MVLSALATFWTLLPPAACRRLLDIHVGPIASPLSLCLLSLLVSFLVQSDVFISALTHASCLTTDAMFIHGRKRTASPTYPLQTSPRLPFWLSLQLLPHNGCSVSCPPACPVRFIHAVVGGIRETLPLRVLRGVCFQGEYLNIKVYCQKTYNGSLTFCQGRGEGGAEKTTGGGAGDRGEGRWALAKGCMSECVRVHECVVRLSEVPGWHESERCHHSQWFKALGSLQVRASALYRTLGYRDGSLFYLSLCQSLSLSLSARTWLCLFVSCWGSGCVTVWSNGEDIWARGCSSHVSDMDVLAWVAPLTPFVPTNQVIYNTVVQLFVTWPKSDCCLSSIIFRYPFTEQSTKLPPFLLGQ